MGARKKVVAVLMQGKVNQWRGCPKSSHLSKMDSLIPDATRTIRKKLSLGNSSAQVVSDFAARWLRLSKQHAKDVGFTRLQTAARKETTKDQTHFLAKLP